MKVAIVGSGPSAWATYQKLKQLDQEIWIIDSGLTEESKQLHEQSSTELGKLNRKLYFGSDLPYRHYPHGPTVHKDGVNPVSSFVAGGLSLVWGATMLPYSNLDTAGWPISLPEFEPYLNEICRLIPITGEEDRLSEVYGSYFSRNKIHQSPRILKFLKRASNLEGHDIFFGSSRLAVETGFASVSGCVYCGQCLTGCPGNFIWNSAGKFKNQNLIKARVIALTEKNAKVTIQAIDLNGKNVTNLQFDKVFLATGPIETFRILATSKIVPKKVVLRDSATFFVPFFAPIAPTSIRNHKSFALSQCFLRFEGKSNTKTVQFQLYEYSDDLIARARDATSLGKFIPKFMLKILLQYMIVGIGYLDGANSPSIRMELNQNGSLYLSNDTNGLNRFQRDAYIKESISKLKRFTFRLGLIPITFLTQKAHPGEGVHSGSWLPMGQTSDLLGRPYGCKMIHVVDSSVLPSIAAGPITFMVMANAMRIAELSCES